MLSENAVPLLMTNAADENADRDWQILLERAATGDVDAFEQVMRRTERSVLSIARRMLGNLADAEEASQEVYIRVFKYLHRFNRTKRLEPWLYRLTINVCNDIATRRPRIEHVQQLDENFAGNSSDPDISIELDERRRL